MGYNKGVLINYGQGGLKDVGFYNNAASFTGANLFKPRHAVSVFERGTIRPHVPQPTQTQGTGLSLRPGTSVGYLCPRWQKTREERFFLAFGLPINQHHFPH